MDSPVSGTPEAGTLLTPLSGAYTKNEACAHSDALIDGQTQNRSEDHPTGPAYNSAVGVLPVQTIASSAHAGKTISPGTRNTHQGSRYGSGFAFAVPPDDDAPDHYANAPRNPATSATSSASDSDYP